MWSTRSTQKNCPVKWNLLMPELGIGCWFWGAACFRVRLARSQTMLGTSPMISLPSQRKNPDIRGGPLGGAVSSKTKQLPCTNQVVFGIWYLLTEFRCKYQCCPQLQWIVFVDCRPCEATVYHAHYRMNLGRHVSIWHLHETDFGGRAHFSDFATDLQTVPSISRVAGLASPPGPHELGGISLRAVGLSGRHAAAKCTGQKQVGAKRGGLEKLAAISKVQQAPRRRQEK